MRRIVTIVAAVLSAVTLLFFPPGELYAKGGGKGGRKGGTVNVRPYTKKDGTYVAPHHRTAPGNSKDNNWSTKGNVNPYTGKPGTKEP